MLETAVLAELLAVVGGDHEQRAAPLPEALERRAQPADLGVHPGDGAVVQVAQSADVRGGLGIDATPVGAVLVDPLGAGQRGQGGGRRRDGAVVVGVEEGRGELLGGHVGVVHRVGVQEQEQVLARRLLQGREPRVEDGLHVAGPVGDLGPALETPVEAHGGLDVAAGGDGHGAVALPGQVRRQRGHVVGQARVAVRVEVHHAVGLGQQAGQHGHVRRRGARRVAVGLLEHDALGGDGVHVRAGVARVPVAAQVVRAQGVDGDQHHVGALRAGRLLGAGPGHPQQGGEGQQRAGGDHRGPMLRCRAPCAPCAVGRAARRRGRGPQVGGRPSPLRSASSAPGGSFCSSSWWGAALSGPPPSGCSSLSRSMS